MSPLYYIAILPDEDVQKKILSLKLELKKQFGLKHALKSPAHITLQMPFRMKIEEEPELLSNIQDITSYAQPAKIDLTGFGSFGSSVIFIKVNKHVHLNLHFNNVQFMLKNKMQFQQQILTKRFHPHITLAHRDLSEDLFMDVWTFIKNEKVSGTFRTNNYTLLIHEKGKWNIHQTFKIMDS